jgi:ATP-binding cassette subfamily B protein
MSCGSVSSGGSAALNICTATCLSHGEHNRLYLARALLQNADLVVIDESFAALDPENLQHAMRCVREWAATLLVIAHP